MLPVRRVCFRNHHLLDIEEGGRLPASYHAYLGVWSEELTRAGYHPGVYCSGMPVKEEPGVTITAADDIRNDAASRDITIWAYNDSCPPSPGCTFPQDPPPPSSSGIGYAAVWQFAQSRAARNSPRIVPPSTHPTATVTPLTTWPTHGFSM